MLCDAMLGAPSCAICNETGRQTGRQPEYGWARARGRNQFEQRVILTFRVYCDARELRRCRSRESSKIAIPYQVECSYSAVK